MCGFTVLIKKRKLDFRKKFHLASQIISYRGPDDKYYYEDKNILMNFFRLSIQDLTSHGRQPMFSASKRYILVFNGEIYNKFDLIKKFNFKKLKSETDTEIILKLFEKKSAKCLDFLDGMFSFVIYDKTNNKIFFARDRFGIKPLYYYEGKEYIFISSEIKPILKFNSIIKFNNKQIFNFFLKQKMDHEDQTFFYDIKSLPPCFFGKIATNYKINLFKYWDINNKKNYHLTDKDCIHKIEKLFSKSIKKHLLSDVEIGSFLSGGTDSTAIASKISENYGNLKTFTYDFLNSGELGESKKSKIVSKALKIKNYKAIIKPIHIKDNMSKICYHLESPFTSIRTFGTFELYKLAKKKGLKVIIEGHGGDEIFAGYMHNQIPYEIDIYNENKNYEKLRALEKTLILKKNKFLRKFSNKMLDSYFHSNVTKDLTPITNIKNFNLDFIEKNLQNLDDIDLDANSFLKNSQLMDIRYISLPRTLKYADRLSMSQGVEARVPFLQTELAKFAYNLPHKHKFRSGETRWAFKQYLKKTKVSNYLTKTKKIIADPQIQWFKNELKDYILDTFNSNEFKNLEFFNSKNIIKNYEKLCRSEFNSSFSLFQILSFYYFYKNFKNF